MTKTKAKTKTTTATVAPQATYSSVTISQLVRWDGNPRPQAEPGKRSELKASIADKGIQTPLIVRHKSGPKSGAARINEVIGGDTRRDIVTELVAEGAWNADREIPVIIRDDLVGNDVAALDVALSDNIHVPMHPMDQFYAFSQMVDMGRDIREIANAYGVSQRVVEQRLSYAKLDDRARQLVKADERDLEWAAAMTMASPQEQGQMLDEIEIEPRRYLTVHDVRRRLEDELVPTTLALFDTAAVADALIRRDLFDSAGATYMRRSEFQPLQDQAVEELCEKRRSEGWSKVSVVSEREFDRFRYEDGITDPSRAEVIMVRHASGAVHEHSGLALRIEERLNGIDAVDDEAGEALFSSGVAATRATVRRNPRTVEGRRTARYIAVSKAMIIQAALMQDPRLTIAVTVAGMIQNAAPRIVEGRIFSDMSEIDPASPARVIVERRLDAARQVMQAGGIDPSLDYGEMITRLLALDDAQLMTLLQTSLAKRVVTDMQRTEMLFETTMAQDGVLLENFWRPDRTYLATLSKDALEQLARQILPSRLLSKVTGGKGDIVETLAQIIDDAHSGGMRLGETERQSLTAWAPASLGGVADDTALFDPNDGEEEVGQAIFDTVEDDEEQHEEVA